jgi:hypothetical protein
MGRSIRPTAATALANSGWIAQWKDGFSPAIDSSAASASDVVQVALPSLRPRA